MEYTVQKLSQLAKITTRTLRYYDEINLLKPRRINKAGYRIYGENEVDRLQQILFYKELGVWLDEIKEILDNPNFDEVEALKEHKIKLLERQQKIELLLKNVNKTINLKEGKNTMTNKEKFEGFKQNIIDENENKYGKEVREKYGDDTVNKSNSKIKGMSQEKYNEFIRLGKEIEEKLAEAFKTNDPSSNLAQEVAELHKKWLMFTWPKYTKEAHAGIAQMYVDDERFTAYYDKNLEGTTKFLRDAIYIYTKMK